MYSHTTCPEMWSQFTMNFETKSIILSCVLFLKYWLQWRIIRKLFNLLTSLCILPYCPNYYFDNWIILIIIVITWLSETLFWSLDCPHHLFCHLNILTTTLSLDCHDSCPGHLIILVVILSGHVYEITISRTIFLFRVQKST